MVEPWPGRQALLPAFLSLLALVPPVAAGGDGNARWWCEADVCHDNEYSYIESCIVITLVICALLFEGCHHVIAHNAHKTYAYGKLQRLHPEMTDHAHSHGHMHEFRVPLLAHLVDRLSEEFMILGLLAFLVFVFREVGGFDKVLELFPPEEAEIHLPGTASDWLHMVENVHMKLFLGMIIYFVLVSRIVTGCTHSIATWEEMRILRRNSLSTLENLGSSESSPDDIVDRTQLRRYGRWRSYFIFSVINWKDRRPKLYEEMLKHMFGTIGDSSGDESVQAVHKALDDHFPFSAYLAYSVRECSKDTVEVHKTTWGVVLVLFVFFALIQRYADMILIHTMPVFIALAFIQLFGLRFVVRRFRERVETSGSRAIRSCSKSGLEAAEKVIHQMGLESDGPSSMAGDAWRTDVDGSRSVSSFGSRWRPAGTGNHHDAPPMLEEEAPKCVPPESFHERHTTELWVLRGVQAVLFVLSYACARTVGDFNDWRSRPQQVLIIASSFTVLFLLLMNMLPKYVPLFAALMALPPYVDRGNVQTFLRVLDEYAAKNTLLSSPVDSLDVCPSSLRLPNSVSEAEGPIRRLEVAIEKLAEQQLCRPSTPSVPLAEQVMRLGQNIDRFEGLLARPTMVPSPTSPTPEEDERKDAREMEPPPPSSPTELPSQSEL